MNERPRIAIVCPLPPWAPGGIERVVAETCRHLREAFDISIYATAQSADQLGERWWEGIRVRVFRACGSTFCLSVPLYKHLQEEKGIALVHAHNYGTFIPLISALTKRDVPLVISTHFHTAGANRFNSSLRKLYDPSVGPIALKKADIVVCNSRSEKDIIVAKFPFLIEKTRIISNGVAIESIRNAQPFAIDAKVVLCVSRLVRYKNVHLVLQALKHLPEEYVAVVVGTGPEEKRLRDLATGLGLGNRARFLGRVTDDEVYSWYRTATVLAHLSEIESFAMVCVEALAAGTPVVANDDRGGLKGTIDSFQPNIVAVDIKRDSVEEIARAIERASRIEVKVDLSHFAWDYVTNQFAQLYVQLIRGNGDNRKAGQEIQG
jgi:glycosyltransferase involved in cell wall biosynthesis